MDTITLYGINFPRELLMFLVNIPLIITIIISLRYIVGNEMLGIYPPLIMSFAFYYLESTGVTYNGLKYGILLLTIIFLSVIVFSRLFSKLKLHYTSKVSLIYLAVIFNILIFTTLISVFSEGRIIRLIPLPVVILITLTDTFIFSLNKKGGKTMFILTFESLITGVIGYFLLKWENFQNFLIYHPEVFLLYFVLIFIIGKYSGLRFIEILRFWNVSNKEDKNK